MEYKKVRDLMRPIADFPIISGSVTFVEAMEALERVQEDFRTGKAPENILLVHDRMGRIIGRLSPMDIVQGLEPNYFQIDESDSMPYGHLVHDALENMRKQYRLWQKPLQELCEGARSRPVESFVSMPDPEQMVDIDDRTNVAFDLFVTLRHGSLFVTDQDRIVGLIRFSDIYAWIKQIMKSGSST